MLWDLCDLYVFASAAQGATANPVVTSAAMMSLVVVIADPFVFAAGLFLQLVIRPRIPIGPCS